MADSATAIAHRGLPLDGEVCWAEPRIPYRPTYRVESVKSVLQNLERLISERLGTRLWEDCERSTVSSHRASRLIIAYAADSQLRSTTNPSLQLPASWSYARTTAVAPQ